MIKRIFTSIVTNVLFTFFLTACTPHLGTAQPVHTVSMTAHPTETSAALQTSPTANTALEDVRTPVNLYINGARLSIELPAYIEDSFVYVPGEEVFSALGYQTYLVENAGNPYFGGVKQISVDDQTKFHIELGSSDGIIDPGLPTERTIHFDAPARYEDGRVMLLMEFVSENPGVTTQFETDSLRVDISDGQDLARFSLQEDVPFEAVIFKRLTSDKLVDNRIGALASGLSMDNFAWEKDGNSPHLSVSEQVNCGIKRWSLTINNQDWEPENWEASEFDLDPRYRAFYEQLTRQGLILTYNLIFKDKDFLRSGGVLGYPRFQDEAEIQRYLDYVRSTVRYFKGVVSYYEIWNEQNIQGNGQYIEPDDYIDLVRRAIPIIREEDPTAKISVGQTTQFDDPSSRAYIYHIIESDLMPYVDAVAIHPFFWDSPEHEREFYYSYPGLLEDVKQTAWEHGFQGEFIASEGNYSPNVSQGHTPTYNTIEAGIYAARGNITNLGMGFSGGIFAITSNDGPAYTMICNLATILAGAQPYEVEVEIQSSAEKIRNYGFSLPNGDILLAIWMDGVARDLETGEPANLRIMDLENYSVTAIDITNNIEQKISSEAKQGFLVIKNLMIKDYPVILRLSPGDD